VGPTPDLATCQPGYDAGVSQSHCFLRRPKWQTVVRSSTLEKNRE
jgi:hypothetical protein